MGGVFVATSEAGKTEEAIDRLDKLAGYWHASSQGKTKSTEELRWRERSQPLPQIVIDADAEFKAEAEKVKVGEAPVEGAEAAYRVTDPWSTPVSSAKAGKRPPTCRGEVHPMGNSHLLRDGSNG